MESIEKKSRILGFAFIIQFVTSFTCGVFLQPRATGVHGFELPENIGETMAHIAKNASLLQLTIVMELVTASGVIFLGAILYATVGKRNKGMALTAFGLYVLEGVFIAVKMLLLFALLVISRQFVAAGSSLPLEPNATVIYEVMSYASKILNFAFCLGGTIFYALLYTSRVVARPMSLWGLASVQGVFIGVLLGLFGKQFPVYLAVAYIPFELVIGIYLIVKGTKGESGLSNVDIREPLLTGYGWFPWAINTYGVKK